ncbi:phosphodiester glycosidase family protein [uncultured Thiodictyon sp.]|jgi:hypothetical protein|uniref:phosphodiester glycosidase family protein n=1 Tax=uncultured Thiodictyon sp. TaxID=1846217 RepID=UPI0025ED9402|nr:phosphodiester glycosidase family protein [uncultured Thiodictyon sp.]
MAVVAQPLEKVKLAEQSVFRRIADGHTLAAGAGGRAGGENAGSPSTSGVSSPTSGAASRTWRRRTRWPSTFARVLRPNPGTFGQRPDAQTLGQTWMMTITRPATLFVSSLLLALWSAPLLAVFPAEQPFPGVRYHQETRQSPPLRLFVAEVDVTNPRLRIRVSPGGPDPDGPGAWETTLMTPTAVAARDGFDLAVNGDFFSIRKPPTATAAPLYQPGVWANVVGPAVSDGRAWSIGDRPRPSLVVRATGRVAIERVAKPPANARAIVAGNVMLVERGNIVAHQNQDKHPRTVLGLNGQRTRLVILVVDGRQGGSSGMSYGELASEMIRLGCQSAINLDGGGSTVMVLRDPATRRWRVLNQPSDGQERPVANVLGITAARADRR